MILPIYIDSPSTEPILAFLLGIGAPFYTLSKAFTGFCKGVGFFKLRVNGNLVNFISSSSMLILSASFSKASSITTY